MEKAKIGILSHGLHLLTPNWQELVWGIPPDKLGRAPRAALLALKENADLLVFGTGASEKDGVKEGAYILNFLLDNFSRLKEFKAFEGISLKSAKEFIASISVPEILSQNTVEEVVCAGYIFVERGVREVRQVSSPFHIFRCYRDAMAAFMADSKLRHLAADLSPVASDTGPKPKEVLIFEPPHRPDQKPSVFYSFVKALWEKPASEREDLINRMASLIP